MIIFRIILQLSSLAYFVWRLYNPDAMVLADPVTLLMIGMGTQAAGQIQAGRAAASEAESAKRVAAYNAAVQAREAKAIRAKGRFDQLRQAKRAARILSTQRVKLAGQGAFGAGLLEEEQEAELELENLMIGYEAETAARRAESQAKLDIISGQLAEKRGKAAKKASYIGAGATLLTGLGTVGMYKKPPGLTKAGKATILRY